MWDMNAIVDSHDIVFITLDTLRYDVADEAFRTGRLPTLSRLMPPTGWERRHAPGNFTLASHQAFFAGFLPTPAAPGPHARLFAADFPGSETTTENSWRFDHSNWVEALGERGYHTICIGGVGFFNKLTPLGSLLPALFQESHWSPELGVTCRESTANQVALAVERIGTLEPALPLLLFINVSAMHQPNCMYLPGAVEDSPQSQLAALAYVDGELGSLFEVLQSRRSLFGVVCSDHGTAYGEEGYVGHRLNHDVVGDVPYFDFRLTEDGAASWSPP